MTRDKDSHYVTEETPRNLVLHADTVKNYRPASLFSAQAKFISGKF